MSELEDRQKTTIRKLEINLEEIAGRLNQLQHSFEQLSTICLHQRGLIGSLQHELKRKGGVKR